MRNLFALLIVAAAITFTSCEKKGEHAENADTTATMSADTTAPATDMTPQQPADSAAMTAPADSAAATTTAPATEEHAH